MANPQVVVDFVANTKGLQKGLKDAGDHSSRLASSLGGLAKGAAIGGAIAGVGALAASLKIGFDEMEQGQQVTAQTNAVLKSTGQAAGVTAGHVQNLAGALLKKSGVDDEAIQSGENLLLTFTNIRNETGKGNDVFDQATKAMLDMSTALGQDMSASAVQLGKALNDPLKGITALQRVGVSFTEQQKDQIKGLVGTGNATKDLATAGIELTSAQKDQLKALGSTIDPLKAAEQLHLKLTDAQKKQLTVMENGSGQLKAQKLILQELNKEFGGSAEAMGKTLPGQIKILREEFNNFAGDVVGKVAPALVEGLQFLQENWPKVAKVIGDVWRTQIKPVLDEFAAFFDTNVRPVVDQFVAFVKTQWPAAAAIFKQAYEQNIHPILQALGPLFEAIGARVVQIAQFIRDNWGSISPVFVQVGKVLQDVAKVVLDVIKLVTALINGDWAQAWTLFKQLVADAWQAVKDQLQVALLEIQLVLKALGPIVTAELKKLPGQIVELLKFIGPQLVTLAGLVKGWGLQFAGWLADAALDELKKLPGQVFDAVKLVGPKLLSLAGTVAGWGVQFEVWYAKALLDELKKLPGQVLAGVELIGPKLVSLAGTVAGWGLALAKALAKGLLDELKKLPGLAWNAIKGIGSLITSNLGDAATWLFDVGRQVVQGLIDGITSKIGDAVGAIKHVASSVIDAAKSPVGFFTKSPSVVFFNIGQDTVQGLIDGLDKKTPDAEKAVIAMAARVAQAAHTKLASAGDQLGAFFQEAFSARQQAVETPAGKLLRQIQNAHDAAARAQALADAQALLAAAQTDEEKLQAQRAVADAQYAIQVAALQKQADAQAAALAGQQFLQQQAFDKQLAALQGYLASAGATTEGARKKIRALMDRFGLDFAEVGSLLGKGFAKGLRSVEDDVVSAAGDLADAVKKALKKGLQIRSPSAWSRDEIGVPVVQGIVAGMSQSSGMLDRAVRGLVSTVSVEPVTVAALGNGSGSVVPPERNTRNEIQVRVFIGDEELRGLVRTEVRSSNSRIARALIAGAV